jgi:hypothetical protein
VDRDGTDDLLQPVLAEREQPGAAGERPWRLSSQVYVALLGGPLAILAIATLNAGRLKLPAAALAWIAAAALVAEAIVIVLANVADLTNAARIVSAAAGVAAYGVAYLVQRSSDRVFNYHAVEEDPYASLLGPGIAAVVVARVVDLIVWLPT